MYKNTYFGTTHEFTGRGRINESGNDPIVIKAGAHEVLQITAEILPDILVDTITGATNSNYVNIMEFYGNNLFWSEISSIQLNNTTNVLTGIEFPYSEIDSSGEASTSGLFGAKTNNNTRWWTDTEFMYAIIDNAYMGSYTDLVLNVNVDASTNYRLRSGTKTIESGAIYDLGTVRPFGTTVASSPSKTYVSCTFGGSKYWMVDNAGYLVKMDDTEGTNLTTVVSTSFSDLLSGTIILHYSASTGYIYLAGTQLSRVHVFYMDPGDSSWSENYGTTASETSLSKISENGNVPGILISTNYNTKTQVAVNPTPPSWVKHASYAGNIPYATSNNYGSTDSYTNWIMFKNTGNEFYYCTDGNFPTTWTSDTSTGLPSPFVGKAWSQPFAFLSSALTHRFFISNEDKIYVAPISTFAFTNFTVSAGITIDSFYIDMIQENDDDQQEVIYCAVFTTDGRIFTSANYVNSTGHFSDFYEQTGRSLGSNIATTKDPTDLYPRLLVGDGTDYVSLDTPFDIYENTVSYDDVQPVTDYVKPVNFLTTGLYITHELINLPRKQISVRNTQENQNNNTMVVSQYYDTITLNSLTNSAGTTISWVASDDGGASNTLPWEAFDFDENQLYNVFVAMENNQQASDLYRYYADDTQMTYVSEVRDSDTDDTVAKVRDPGSLCSCYVVPVTSVYKFEAYIACEPGSTSVFSFFTELNNVIKYYNNFVADTTTDFTATLQVGTKVGIMISEPVEGDSVLLDQCVFSIYSLNTAPIPDGTIGFLTNTFGNIIVEGEVLGSLVIEDDLDVGADVTVGGTAAITGNTTVGGTLSVVDSITMTDSTSSSEMTILINPSGGDLTLTLPFQNGTVNQVLTNNGSGVMNWNTINDGYYTCGYQGTTLGGGSATSGAWRITSLGEFEKAGNLTGVSVVSNQVTNLPTGKYYILGFMSFYNTTWSQCSLYDVSNTNRLVISSIVRSSSNNAETIWMQGIVDLDINDVYELQYDVSTTVATYGLGVNNSFGSGVTMYRSLTFIKIKET